MFVPNSLCFSYFKNDPGNINNYTKSYLFYIYDIADEHPTKKDPRLLVWKIVQKQSI